MKYLNVSLVIGLFALFLSACSVSKEARVMKRTINGDWMLQTITTEGIPGVATTKIFNEEDFSCFIGSKWNFIANNSMGSYSIVDKNKECTPIKRLIRWSIFEQDGMDRKFQFKRLDDRKNAMDNGDGYRLEIVKLDKHQMKLRSEIAYGGSAGAVVYNFVRL